jgi:hypothetical protein
MTLNQMTYIILVGVNRLRIEALFAFLVALFNVLAHPNVPVQPEDEVHVARQANEV